MPNNLNAMLERGSPMSGMNPFTPPQSVPQFNTTDFRAGQGSPATQMRGGQNYQQGGLVTPQGPMPPPAPGGMGAGQAMNPQSIQAEVERMRRENPEVIQQIQAVIQSAIQQGKLTMQQLNMAVELASAALQNPQMYPQLRNMAIQQGLVDDDELPMQFDPSIPIAIIIAGEAVRGTQAGAPAAAGQPPEASMAAGGMTGKSKNTDGSIAATVHEDEYVIPRSALMFHGKKTFDKLVAQAAEDGNPKQNA